MIHGYFLPLNNPEFKDILGINFVSFSENEVPNIKFTKFRISDERAEASKLGWLASDAADVVTTGLNFIDKLNDLGEFCEQMAAICTSLAAVHGKRTKTTVTTTADKVNVDVSEVVTYNHVTGALRDFIEIVWQTVLVEDKAITGFLSSALEVGRAAIKSSEK